MLYHKSHSKSKKQTRLCNHYLIGLLRKGDISKIYREGYYPTPYYRKGMVRWDWQGKGQEVEWNYNLRLFL